MCTPTEETIIHAVRNHPVIGRGTCSYIDECWTDEEIMHHINDPVMKWDGTTAGAVAQLVAVHNLWQEREREVRNA